MLEFSFCLARTLNTEALDICSQAPGFSKAALYDQPCPHMGLEDLRDHTPVWAGDCALPWAAFPNGAQAPPLLPQREQPCPGVDAGRTSTWLAAVLRAVLPQVLGKENDLFDHLLCHFTHYLFKRPLFKNSNIY